MLLPFDPVGERDFWRQTRLQYMIDDEPRVHEKEQECRGTPTFLTTDMPAGS